MERAWPRSGIHRNKEWWGDGVSNCLYRVLLIEPFQCFVWFPQTHGGGGASTSGPWEGEGGGATAAPSVAPLQGHGLAPVVHAPHHGDPVCVPGHRQLHRADLPGFRAGSSADSPAPHTPSLNPCNLFTRTPATGPLLSTMRGGMKCRRNILLLIIARNGCKPHNFPVS